MLWVCFAMLQLFGVKYKQKLLFVPDADNKPKDKYKISDHVVFRFLLDEETSKQLREAKVEMPEELDILKDIDKESKIVEFEIHQSSMGSATDTSKAFHVFIVFKTTSEIDGDYWWSLEKNLEYIVLQRSRNKDNVEKKMYGDHRGKSKSIVQNLVGKGTIQDLLALLWANQVILEKYHIKRSNCQSLVTFISKQITEQEYEYKGVFPYFPPRESGQEKEMLDLINILKVSFEWHPIFTLIHSENTDLFDKVTKDGEYSMLGITQYGFTPLHFAIVFSKTKMVQHLLKPPYSVDPTRRDENGMNALDIAAMFTNETKIIDDLLLEQDKGKTFWVTAQKVEGMSDVNDQNEQGVTALHYAALTSNEIAAEHLIKKGADVNHRDFEGNTPLHVAAFSAMDMQIIDVLLKNIRGEEIGQYKNDAMLLPYACSNVHGLKMEIINQLVAKGMVSNEQVQNPQVLEAQNLTRSKPNEHGLGGANLMEGKGAVPVMKRIYLDIKSKWPDYFRKRDNKDKADSIEDIIGDDSVTTKVKVKQVFSFALRLAIMHSDVEKARILFTKFKAYLSKVTWEEQKCNALHLASQYAKTNMIDVILETGKFDINGADNRGATPLHYTMVGSNAATNARYLLGKEADPTIGDNMGNTPFHTAAAFSRDPAILDLFLANNKKFDINHKNKSGMTALHTAVMESNSTTASFLLSKGANPNVADRNGRTPLHWAAILAKDMEIIKLLLNRKDTNVNLLDNKQNDVLHYAKMNRHGLSEVIANKIHQPFIIYGILGAVARIGRLTRGRRLFSHK